MREFLRSFIAVNIGQIEADIYYTIHYFFKNHTNSQHDVELYENV